MANSVDLIIGAEAIKQVESLISKLSLADAELVKISQSASTASKGINGISTPSGLDKAVSNTSALNAQLEKQNAIITKLHADIAKKAEQSRLAEIRLQQQREKAFDSFEKNAQKEAAIQEKNANAYNKTQTQINNLTKVYNDLALRKERYNNLSANEEMRLVTLGKVTEKYNGILKATDATIGKNQRNVGNYASGFNALGNSINQLSREAPAFANSVNTGFMALSNNFPALFDAINGIRDKNKLLIAEGKPTVSLFSSLSSAIFSWQTLLSLGVTLLTIYGGKLVDMARGLGDVKEETDKLIARQTRLDNSISDVTKTILHNAKLQIDKAKLRNASQKEQDAIWLKAQNEVLNQMQIAEKSNLEKRYQDAKKYREALANESTIIINQYSSREDKIKKSKEQADIFALSKLGKVTDEQFKILEDAHIKRKNQIIEQGILISELTSSQQVSQYEDENKKKKANQAKAKREDLDHLESYIKPVSTIVDEINKEIDRLTTEKIIANQEELPAINEQLRLLLELKKQLNEVPTGGPLPNAIVVPNSKPELDKLKTDWKETFNEIADSAQKAGEIIAGFSEMNFNNEYARLEAQKDISLKFAGDSAEAKAKIEEDYEKKRKEIANRENKAKQKQALFNIAIDTAQAVVEALPNIPLAIAMGVFGAAQAVLVASQKVPEYFAGTDNHQGGLMLVNDGGGSNFQEKVILPNGKEVMPEGRNVLMNAPKGTKVLTHEQQIREMLNERGISMSANYTKNNGMTAEEMDMVMSKHFSRIQVNNTSFDKKGFSSWSERNGNRTKQNANRVSRTGFKV